MNDKLMDLDDLHLVFVSWKTSSGLKTNQVVPKSLLSLVVSNLDYNGIDDLQLRIYNTCTDALSVSAPLKCDSIKHSCPVCFNIHFIRVRNKENRLCKKSKRNGGIIDYTRRPCARLNQLNK
uniref:Uncharacterized protein n=1 Tax=Glossina austeni TaxID=7395 RepID=A0A1A9V8F1_GLOAU